jgi:hypothetical protein
MDYTTATKAIDTMGAMVAKQKPFCPRPPGAVKRP